MFARLDPAHPGRDWFERDAPEVAPDLLNKVLIAESHGVRCSGRIIETEAYMPDDPASHTFIGRTDRNAVMFGPAGHLYVYLSYGIHHCLNVVTGPVGSGQAVLIRALEPLEGIEAMRTRRPGRRDRELADGPGKLAAALAVDLGSNGANIVLAKSRPDVAIVDDGMPPPITPVVGPRVGLTRATETPWRFRVPTT